MTIFENIEQLFNHLDTEEQINEVTKMLHKRRLQLGLIKREQQ